MEAAAVLVRREHRSICKLANPAQAHVRRSFAKYHNDQPRHECDVKLAMEYSEYRRLRQLELKGHRHQELGRDLWRRKYPPYTISHHYHTSNS